MTEMIVNNFHQAGVYTDHYYFLYYHMHLPVQMGGPVPPLIVSLVTLASQHGKLVVGGDTVLVVAGSILEPLALLHLVRLPHLVSSLPCLVSSLRASHMLSLVVVSWWYGTDKLG